MFSIDLDKGFCVDRVRINLHESNPEYTPVKANNILNVNSHIENNEQKTSIIHFHSLISEIRRFPYLLI